MPSQSAAVGTDAPPSYVTRRTSCRLCKQRSLQTVWDFGSTALANSYLTAEQLTEPELIAPLTVAYCATCHLLQLRDVVHPDLLFRNYLYVSSTSPHFVQHFEDFASHLIQRFGLGQQTLVIDVGSNDGVLLRPLAAAGVRILGIDPAENIAAEACAAGIPTIAAYLNPAVARAIASEHGRAAVVTANNVFAHTDNIDRFVQGVQELLDEDGIFVFEVQYARDLVENNLFDIVYHEHTNYYLLTPLVSYFAQYGMQVFDVQRLPVHGGSLRVFVERAGGKQPTAGAVQVMLTSETAAGFTTPAPYRKLAERVAANKRRLREMLDELKAQGKRIAGFGAPAKATTLMHYFGVTGADLDYIVDDAPLKQGRFMPGTHIPILPPARLYEDVPDYCLILAWNFAEPIMSKHRRFAENGGAFIVPVPEPHIASDASQRG